MMLCEWGDKLIVLRRGGENLHIALDIQNYLY